jgi:hypothetical protein
MKIAGEFARTAMNPVTGVNEDPLPIQQFQSLVVYINSVLAKAT